MPSDLTKYAKRTTCQRNVHKRITRQQIVYKRATCQRKVLSGQHVRQHKQELRDIQDEDIFVWPGPSYLSA